MGTKSNHCHNITFSTCLIHVNINWEKIVSALFELATDPVPVVWSG